MSERAETPASGEAAEAGDLETAGRPHGASASDADQKEQPRRIGLIKSLDQITPLMDYLRAIGAEPINFRCAVVREIENGYPRETGRVKIAGDGAVDATGAAEPPSKDQAKAIKDAFATVTLPTLMPLKFVAGGPTAVDLGSEDVFQCHDFDGRVAMIHQRYRTDEGGKGFVPWTYWSDGEWRKMEPDRLPFYGLPGHEKASRTLYIHEGAKAARRVRALISGQRSAERFPWLASIKHGHHIGWLGGVHAFNRSEWSGLRTWMRRHGFERAVAVCDNDRGGKDIVRRMSSELRVSMSAIMFDDRFPATYDMGDEIPATMFEERGGKLVCIAPSIAELSRPATWATERVASEARGRPAYVLRDEFIAECYVSVTPPRIFWAGREYSPSEFNVAVRPYSDVEDTARLLNLCPSVVLDGVTFDPTADRGVVASENGMLFNMHRKTRIKRRAGNAAPFLRYMTHLIPRKADRLELLRWVATLIARPDIRMRYAPLLTSETQGVGKTTLAEHILTPLLHPSNVSAPGDTDVVESSFNGWIAFKRLVIINELYAGDSRRASNKLKPLITDATVRVNLKFQPEYEVQNQAHFYACSNAKVPLLMDAKDRRWFIPEVTERTRPAAFWEALHRWLAADGLEIIHQWAFDFVAKHGPVSTSARAPVSVRKASMIEDSVPEGKRHLADYAQLLRELAEAEAPVRVMVPFNDFREAVAREMGLPVGDKRVPGLRAIRDGLTDAGLIVRMGDDKVWVSDTQKIAVVMNFNRKDREPWTELAKKHLKRLGDIGGINAL